MAWTFVFAIFLADSGVGAVIEIHQSDVIVIVPTVQIFRKRIKWFKLSSNWLSLLLDVGTEFALLTKIFENEKTCN